MTTTALDPVRLVLRLTEDALREEAAREGATDPQYDWPAHARASQLPPADMRFIWLIMAGRGWGKTRTGSEFVRARVEAGLAGRIAFVAETKADARDVMVEDPKSGILAVSPPNNRPLWESSKRRLTWPNGAVATIYSGDEPDQLRGPQHDLAWCDELAKFKYADDAWSNLMFGLRIGDPHCLVTTTPRPIKKVRELVKQDNVTVTSGHTHENLANLAPSFRQEVMARYEGTRLGRQELAAELLEDVEGALWEYGWIDQHRVKEAPELTRVVVGIDPSGSDDEGASEQGIITAGVAPCACKGNGTVEQHAFVLRDASGHRTPDQWARVAIACYDEFSADRIVAESNFGGAMVEATIRGAGPGVPYRALTASRGKAIRAEPIAAFYEQGKVHHVGAFPVLEDQLCTWVPGEGRSPDRLDALVWTLTELLAGPRWGAA